MRNAKLTILASLSLVMLAVLAWGYVGFLNLIITYVSVTSSGKTGRAVYVEFWHGQVVVGLGPRLPTADSPGLHVLPECGFRPSLARDRLWGFQINRYSGSGAPGDSSVALICPLWFAALPFTIAPIAWLRRRRRRETRGFAVEGKQPSEPAGKQPNQPPEPPTDQQTPTGV